MAATGKTPILLYGSTTATNTPVAGNLTNSSDGCEIAINVADKNLFFKDATNTVNTVPIRQSSASSNGWLSSTDWSTFNSKQPAGTYVTSVTGTAPVVSSGGTTPAISMAAATGSVNGYLTSTDWTTFNGKQAALVSGTNIKTVNGTTLLGSGDLGTIAIGYGGTGKTSFTANQIHYGSFSQSAALTFDGTNLITSNNLLVNTSSSGGAFNNSVTVNSGANALAGIHLVNNTTGIAYNTGVQLNVNGANGYLSSFNGPLYIQTNGYNIRATFDTSGNMTINNGNLIVGTSGKGITTGSAIPLGFGTNGSTTQATLFSSGGVSIGNTTDPGATNLSVTGSTTSAVFKTSSGTISAANNTFTTFFTAPSLNNGTYIVSCNVIAGDPTNYSAVSIVTVDATVLRATALQTAGLLAIQISGQNIQAKQQSGTTTNILWTVTRVS